MASVRQLLVESGLFYAGRFLLYKVIRANCLRPVRISIMAKKVSPPIALVYKMVFRPGFVFPASAIVSGSAVMSTNAEKSLREMGI